jgi:hypothetical protein
MPREVEVAAGAFRFQLQYLDVRDPNDVEAAFRAANKGRAEAVLVLLVRCISMAKRPSRIESKRHEDFQSRDSTGTMCHYQSSSE